MGSQTLAGSWCQPSPAIHYSGVGDIFHQAMAYIPTSILNLLGMTRTPPPLAQDMASKMRELVMDQQRTMFYTVTMTPDTADKKTQKNCHTITEVAVCQLPHQVPQGAQQDQHQLPQLLHTHLHRGGGGQHPCIDSRG